MIGDLNRKGKIVNWNNYDRLFENKCKPILSKYVGEGDNQFTQKELDRGVSTIIVGMIGAIRSLEHDANTPIQYLGYVNKVKEWIHADELPKEARMTHEYDKVRAFIHKDAEEVAGWIRGSCFDKVIIPEEKMPAYMDIMKPIAKYCVEFCVDKFKQDIEAYRQKQDTPEKWQERVSDRKKMLPTIPEEKSPKKLNETSWTNRFPTSSNKENIVPSSR